MTVSVAYVERGEHFWRTLQLPEGSTAQQAIAQSGLQQRFPAADPERLKIGIFSKPVQADHILSEGDRVELYRPISTDPEQVARRERNDHEGQQS
ncbi:hypothetical protein CKO15_06720 [Halorhodospira abdelmalekii]|nr:hypothetical protein [Halorhodospira abdelmalekii]